MVSSAEGASAPPQSPERMILQAAASVQPRSSHDSGGVPVSGDVPDVADGAQPIRPPGRES